MLNVGDEIEIVCDLGYFGLPSGTKGLVLTVTNLTYELEFNGICQSLAKGEEHRVKLLSKIEVGDIVEYIGTDQQYAGLYGNVLASSPSSNTVIVQFNFLTSRTVLYKSELRRVSSPVQPAPSQQSQTPQHTYGAWANSVAQGTLNAVQQYYTGNLMTVDDSGLWVNYKQYGTQKESGCQHEWRDYIGLSKRMDICTKCPASKNERGIYE